VVIYASEKRCWTPPHPTLFNYRKSTLTSICPSRVSILVSILGPGLRRRFFQLDGAGVLRDSLPVDRRKGTELCRTMGMSKR
jgi:hypothetical protein